MKRIITVMLLCIAISSNAQIEHVKELIKLSGLTKSKAQAYLTERNWQFSSTKYVDEFDMTGITWGINIKGGDSKVANQWISYFSSPVKNTMVVYKSDSRAFYKESIRWLKQEYFTVTDTKFYKDEVTTTYTLKDSGGTVATVIIAENPQNEEEGSNYQYYVINGLTKH